MPSDRSTLSYLRDRKRQQIHGADEVFIGWIISPHNIATEEPKKVSAQNPRQYVLPIKYVIGIRAHRTGRPDKNKAKQTQIIQTKKSDRKEVSK